MYHEAKAPLKHEAWKPYRTSMNTQPTFCRQPTHVSHSSFTLFPPKLLLASFKSLDNCIDLHVSERICIRTSQLLQSLLQPALWEVEVLESRVGRNSLLRISCKHEIQVITLKPHFSCKQTSACHPYCFYIRVLFLDVYVYFCRLKCLNWMTFGWTTFEIKNAQEPHWKWAVLHYVSRHVGALDKAPSTPFSPAIDRHAALHVVFCKTMGC